MSLNYVKTYFEEKKFSRGNLQATIQNQGGREKLAFKRNDSTVPVIQTRSKKISIRK